MAQPQQPSSATAEQVRGPRSPEEDAQLRSTVQTEGPHRPFTLDEDAIIMNAYELYGKKWATIARLLVGRTGNSVKNRWYATLRRRVLGTGSLGRQGEDPWEINAARGPLPPIEEQFSDMTISTETRRMTHGTPICIPVFSHFATEEERERGEEAAALMNQRDVRVCVEVIDRVKTALRRFA